MIIIISYNKMKMIKTEYNNRDLIKRVKIYLNFFIKSNFNYILLLLLYFLGEYVQEALHNKIFVEKN